MNKTNLVSASSCLFKPLDFVVEAVRSHLFSPEAPAMTWELPPLLEHEMENLGVFCVLFDADLILKAVIGFVVILLLGCLCFVFWGRKAHGDQLPTRDESMAPAVEGEVFTTDYQEFLVSGEFGISRIC